MITELPSVKKMISLDQFSIFLAIVLISCWSSRVACLLCCGDQYSGISGKKGTLNFVAPSSRCNVETC